MEAKERRYEDRYAHTSKYAQTTTKAHTPSVSPQQKQNTPVKKFRAGSISATIWENQAVNAEGQVVSFKNVTFDRSYKDAKGEWQNTNALRTADLPKAILVLNKAYEYLACNHEEETY
jgi:hypothetical protein